VAGTLLLVLYFAILFLPGYAVFKLFRLQFDPFNFSVSFSYAIFTLVFIVANYFTIPASTLAYFVTSYLFLAAGYITFFVCYKGEYRSNEVKSRLLPIAIIGSASAAYQSVFGSFLEVPADIYTHIERYQHAIADLRINSLGDSLLWKELLFQKSGVFYYLLAGAAQLTNNSTGAVVATIDFANRTLFLCAIYFFTKTIYRGKEKSTAIAGITVIFVALHMGINVFSYVRYYSLAPTMLNMVVYLATIGIFLSTIPQNLAIKNIGTYLIILLLILTTSAVHIQETIFTIIIIVLISAIILLSKLRIMPYKFDVDYRQSLIVVVLGILGFISVYLYSHYNLIRAPNAHWRLWEFGSGFGFIPDITTLNLKLQFPQVMTLWGLLVYFLFFLNFNRYRGNLFILAGMLSPIFTILNPFFIDLFLRHYNSTAVWRLCYLIPVHFVAGDLFVHYFNKFFEYSKLKPSFNSQFKSILKIVSIGLILIAMLGLLLPIQNTWQNVHYSRFPTLGQSAKSLSPAYYQGLISKLESLEQHYEILTDPMTGYMISAMTRHHSRRKKFFRDYRFKHFTFLDYSNNPLKKYRDHLLVVNKRKKGQSIVGKLSDHWAEKQWEKTDRYYPPQLLAHLNSNPNLFELLWSENDVQVYRVL